MFLMDLSDYKIGEWIPELGKYKKICALKECRSAFPGRKNRDHCTDFCKTKKNNDIAAKRRELAKRYTDATLKANNLFLDLIEDWDGMNAISKDQLFHKGYTQFAPGRSAKYNKYHGDWWCIGAFAHRKEENAEGNIEFIYVENLK